MSSIRVRFCCAASSFSSAVRRRARYFVTPAASSISCRRSVGRELRIIPIFPCSMIAYAFAPSPVSISRSWMSLRRQICPSIRYSLSPDRYSRLVTSISRATDWITSSSSVCGNDGSAATAWWPLPFPLLLSWWPLPEWPLEPGSAGPVTVFRNPLNRSRTSAVAVGLRASLPLNRTSSIRSPRRLFALCSPMTQVIASATLLLPHPLGPTMAVTPLSKASSDLSEKDLNPLISRRSRRISQFHCGLRSADCGFQNPRTSTSRRIPILQLNPQSAIRDRQCEDWLGSNRITTVREPTPSGRMKAAPRLKTAVSLARPSYRGKRNLQHYSLWSLARTTQRHLPVSGCFSGLLWSSSPC